MFCQSRSSDSVNHGGIAAGIVQLASVLLHKGIGSTTISFGVQDGVWNQAGMLSSFEELAREVAPEVGGFPIEVQLVDSSGNVEETSRVGEGLSTAGTESIISVWQPRRRRGRSVGTSNRKASLLVNESMSF
jgi:hypothetical protein